VLVRSRNLTKARYILSVTGADHTGATWLSAFNEQGIQLLGKTADELHQMRNEGNEAEFEQIFQDVLFKQFVFKIRAKMESYQDESRLKCSVIEAEPVNFATEGWKLLQEIQAV